VEEAKEDGWSKGWKEYEKNYKEWKGTGEKIERGMN
jgi:hypothetical protein